MINKTITYNGVVYVLVNIIDFEKSPTNECSLCDVEEYCLNAKLFWECSDDTIFKNLSNLRKEKINKILND